MMQAVLQTLPAATPERSASRFAEGWNALLRRFMEYLISECGLADNTIEAYQRDLREFVCELDEQRVGEPRDVTPLVVRGFLIRLSERKLALSSIARHLVSVKMFLRYLFTVRILTEDVSTLLETPKKWQTLPTTLHLTEVEAMLAAPQPGEPFYTRDKAILEMLYATGLRVSELAGLRVKDLNLTVGYVRCLGKGSKERIVPIGTQAIQAVHEYLGSLRQTLLGEGSPIEALFLTRTGKPMDRTNIWRLVSRYAGLAGIHLPVGPHTLRHCFATHMLEGGADLRIVQELLGHADVATTQIYIHVDKSRLKGIHRKCHPRQ
jgi:integrase/recombinase XerD